MYSVTNCGENAITMTMFFFSSRRRHTRSLCDWSSDVCSSDLHRHDTAHGMSGDDRGSGLLPLEESCEQVGERPEIGAAGRRPGAAVAGEVRHEDAMALGEQRREQRSNGSRTTE